jgi:hypothetical protein
MKFVQSKPKYSVITFNYFGMTETVSSLLPYQGSSKDAPTELPDLLEDIFQLFNPSIPNKLVVAKSILRKRASSPVSLKRSAKRSSSRSDDGSSDHESESTDSEAPAPHHVLPVKRLLSKPSLTEDPFLVENCGDALCPESLLFLAKGIRSHNSMSGLFEASVLAYNVMHRHASGQHFDMSVIQYLLRDIHRAVASRRPSSVSNVFVHLAIRIVHKLALIMGSHQLADRSRQLTCKLLNASTIY